MRPSNIGIALVLVLLDIGATSAAGTPAQKCEAAKQNEAGKDMACRLKAEAAFVTSGDATKLANRLAKCSARMIAKYAKLDAADTCAHEGEAADVDGLITLAVATVHGCLTGGSCILPPDDCGNGTLEGGEECDQGELGGGSCVSEGFAAGRLGCTTACRYDTSMCWTSRFVDEGDGTVTDNHTALVWEKKVELNGVVDPFDLHDADNVHRWAGTCSIGGADCQPDAASEAACLAGVEGDVGGCAQCVSGVCNVGGSGVTVWEWLVDLNAASFAGHDDWRLPAKRELESLVDVESLPPAVDAAFHGASCGASCSDVADPACSCTRSDSYWTSSSYAPTIGRAWNFDFGVVLYSAGVKASDGRHVRAVRGGS